jgi:hypothetical protein
MASGFRGCTCGEPLSPQVVLPLSKYPIEHIMKRTQVNSLPMMVWNRRSIATLASGLLTLALVLTGCGGSEGPPTVKVSGVVTLDGKPLADADVNFVSKMHAGYGKTDKDGKFQLVSGAVVGENIVYFSKIDDPKFVDDPANGMDAGQLAAAAAATGGRANAPKGQLVPPEFASADSKLKFMVPDGGTSSANFDLTGGAK